MLTRYISLIFLGAAIVSCHKSKPIGSDEYITLKYQQTSCSDPWTNAASDSLTKANIAAYLNAAGLYIAGLEIKQDGIAETCLACFCKTGKTIYVSTFNNEVTRAKYLQIGFK